jgi:hypothetical protein
MKKRIITGLLLALAAIAAYAQEAPRWLLRRTAVYPPEQYVSGVGEGRTAEEARDRALAQIARFFDTRVEDTQRLIYSYNEALAGVTERTQAGQDTVVRSQADFFGVEFAEAYTDGGGTVHALAYFDREKALGVYDGRIQANALLIGDLIKRYENSGNPKEAVRHLEEAKWFALLTAEYADMAVLLDSRVSPRYDELPAVASRIDGMIEANKRRYTATVTLNDEAARPRAHKTAELLRRAGFMVTEAGGVYAVFINFQPNEGSTKNYRTVEPALTIRVESGSGDPLVMYTKKYAVFRHITESEALARALRNIEQDLGGEFYKRLREIGQ